MDDDTYSFSLEGARMMATILYNATELGLFDKSLLSENNMGEYINTLANVDSLWEGYSIEDLEERKIMLVMALMGQLKTNTKLN